jgi:NADPH:quinone reductase
VKAIVMREFGGPEVLRVEQVPTPVPADGEVLVRVHAVTVNQSLDLKVRAAGQLRGTTLPHVLGVDPAGVVAGVAADVTSTRVGDRVAVLPRLRCGKCEFCTSGREAQCPNSGHIGVNRWGGYAEYVAVPEANVLPLPDTLSFPDAAVVLRHAPTAFHLLRELAGVTPGAWVLVMGAAGGLGSMGVQVAKLLGATVVAGAGADARVETARDNGADHGVNYRTQDLTGEVLRLTSGRGVDVVFENIGDPVLWPKAFASLAQSGCLVTAGAHGGGKVELDVRRLYGRRLRILGGAGYSRADIHSAIQAATAGSLHAVVDRVLPLEEAAQAHRLAEKGDLLGKIVLDPTAAEQR